MADPLSLTASIIAVIDLTSKVVKYLNDVKNASTERAKCAIEAAYLQSLLLNLRFRIEEESSSELWLTTVKSLSRENGPLDQYKQALKELERKLEPKDNALKRAATALVWKFSKEEIENILSKMERLKSLIQIALQMDHMKLAQVMKADTATIRAHMPIIQKGVEELQKEQSRSLQNEITEWISTTNFPAQQSDIIDRKQEGTAQWFLEDPTFKTWLHQSKGTLFCPGIPGAGKTMMAANTIDYLRTLQNDSVGIVCIFCNYKLQTEQSANTLLAALLKQLVQQQSPMIEPVSALYNLHSRNRTKPSLGDICGTLQSVIKRFSTVYIVADALDECSTENTRGLLLSKLFNIQKEADIRLLVTSRFIPDIISEFEQSPRLEVRASDKDVRKFVKGQIYNLPMCVQRDKELQTFVEESIAEAVAGMFLLARLYVDSLLDKKTKAKVKATLNRLSDKSTKSKSLGQAYDQAYDDAITRIEGQLPGNVSLAKSTLTWLLCSVRRLTNEELCHALAVELDSDEFDEDNICCVEDIVSVCAGLVVVDEQSNVIRLVHYTTQEYFERKRETWLPDAQMEIASICLTYLSFNRPEERNRHFYYDSLKERHRLFGYAARYWGEHAQTVQEQVFKLVSYLVLNADLVQLAFAATILEDGIYRGDVPKNVPTNVIGLHLPALFGLIDICKRLLMEDHNLDANLKDSMGRTPLSWAAIMNSEASVRSLVEQKDVEADLKDCEGRTPLSLAAQTNSEASIRVLLGRKDVDANSKNIKGQTPLSLAAEQANEASVRLLLANSDVEADSKDETGRTPLSHAAESIHNEAVVRLLLGRKDVQADSKDEKGRTPLSYAAGSLWRNESTLRLFLERKDVEADSKDVEGRTPLSYAASTIFDEEIIVRLLLERKDVEADSKDVRGRTPLSHAASRDNENIVRLLLERNDVEADSKDVEGRTPLSYSAASTWNNPPIVRLLLDRKDVEADSKDVKGSTPLSYAARAMNNEATVKLLLEREDVEVNSIDVEGRTPLSYAVVERNSEAVVKLLLERRDVEVNSKDVKGRTPLSHAAASWGNDTNVRLLLKRQDVEVNSKDEMGWTPFSWAGRSNDKRIAELLLNSGADPNSIKAPKTISAVELLELDDAIF